MARPEIDAWLELELDRIWLIAERRLRRLQAAHDRRAGLPPPHVEGILAARRGKRGGTTVDLAEIDRALAACNARLAAVRAEVPLGRIAARLGLQPLELDVIAATLAPLVDPPFAELLHVLRGSHQLDLVLLAELLELDRTQRLALLGALEGDRPLVRWNLVSVGDPRAPHPTLHIAPDLLSALRGERELPPELVAHAALRMPPATVDDLVLAPDVRARFERLLAGYARAADPPWLVLYGAAGSGRRELATRCAAAAGRNALVFEPNAESAPLLAVAQRAAVLHGAVLVVGPVSGSDAAELVQRFKRYPDPVCFVLDGTEPLRLETSHPVHEIAFAPLAHAQASELWKRALGTTNLDPSSLVDAYRLTPGDILGAVAVATTSAQLEGRELAVGDLRRGVELRLRSHLADVVERVANTYSFADVVLCDADVERLREFIGRKRYARVVYEEWGLAQRIRYGKGMIALFSGPPGTGKTMLAGVIANELGMDLYRVDLSQVVSKWAGETEKQLAKIFDIAERTQAVLLFDEADSLFAKRGEVEGGNDRFANLTVNYLLQRLEAYPGIAVLTTNKQESLDEALQRRLSLHLRLELPEVDERIRLWRSFLDHLPGAATIDVRWLANRFELSGGSIKNAAVRAAFLAAAQRCALDLATVIAAVERELDDMGRVVWQLPAVRHVASAVDFSDVILE
jgi:hypothetical protein